MSTLILFVLAATTVYIINRLTSLDRSLRQLRHQIARDGHVHYSGQQPALRHRRFRRRRRCLSSSAPLTTTVGNAANAADAADAADARCIDNSSAAPTGGHLHSDTSSSG